MVRRPSEPCDARRKAFQGAEAEEAEAAIGRPERMGNHPQVVREIFLPARHEPGGHRQDVRPQFGNGQPDSGKEMEAESQGLRQLYQTEGILHIREV